MKHLPLVALCVVLSVVAGVLARGLEGPARPAVAVAPTPEPGAERIAALERALEAQRGELEALRREFGVRIAGLSRRELDTPQAPADPQVDPVPQPAPPRASGSANGGLPEERSAEDWLALLGTPDFTDLEREGIWLQIARAGRTRELIALFEKRAEQSPYDPDVQVELGGAYLRMLQEVGQGPLAGQWAGRADAAFDRALELDPEHVGARLSKAISLSFWPPIFGKQAEAVKQFETLIGQLEGKPLQPQHSQAWLLLGNLHQQQGQAEKALAVWQAGAALFPGDAALGAKLGQ